MRTMEHRYACFACTTPYQLLGAISIVQGNGIEADLYLIGSFDGYEEIAKRLKAYNIFKSIFLVSRKRDKNISRIKVIWQILNKRRILKSYLPSNLSYEYFYSSSKAHSKLLLFFELRRRNPKLKYVIYEDGTGTYSKYAPSLNSSRHSRLFELICRSKVYIPEKTSIMVHYPSFLWLPEELKSIPKMEMPLLSLSAANKKMLKDVFGMEGVNTISSNIILFDTARSVYRNDSFDLALLDDCFKAVLDLFPFQDVVLKAHPKSNAKTSLNVMIYQHSEIPMEVLYSDMADLDNCILIGNHTTALYTPKMLFGKEPIVISLHEIVWKSKPQISKIFERFRTMYDQRDRFFAPKNIEELVTFLTKLKLNKTNN